MCLAKKARIEKCYLVVPSVVNFSFIKSASKGLTVQLPWIFSNVLATIQHLQLVNSYLLVNLIFILLC